MRFLAKSERSTILTEGLVYRKRDNRRLRELLLAEQRQYCAYTEQRLQQTDSVDVEHFDPRLKNTTDDDYWNYYAVLHHANQRKRRKERRYVDVDAAFFASRFLQEPAETFAMRVGYVAEDGVYEETRRGDTEAAEFIDYLGFNDPELHEVRSKHVARLRDLFRDADWGANQQTRWFRDHSEETSFVTAIEETLGVEIRL